MTEVSERAAEEHLDFTDVDLGWDPFSIPESIWHACPGHTWERGLWDKQKRTFTPFISKVGNGIAEAHIHGHAISRYVLITRCSGCGAPRCTLFAGVAAGGLPSKKFARLSDHDQQLYRCTQERHHPVGTDLGKHEGHDYLTA